MHSGVKWEDLKSGLFADAGSFLPLPQGPYWNQRNGCLYAEEIRNVTCVSSLKGCSVAIPKKSHSGFYCTDKQPGIQLNLI